MWLLLGFRTWGRLSTPLPASWLGQQAPYLQSLGSLSTWGPGEPGWGHLPVQASWGCEWAFLAHRGSFSHPGASQRPRGTSPPWSRGVPAGLACRWSSCHLVRPAWGAGCAPWEGPWPAETPVPGPLWCFYREWVWGIGRLVGFVWPHSGKLSVEGRGRRHPSMWQCPHDWAAAWPARSCAWSPPQRDSRASLPRRLEQPYFSANAQFFQALSQCSALQRLCLVSRSGTLQPEAVLAFMARCLRVVVCHMFTGESLATCKSLQQSLLRR